MKKIWLFENIATPKRENKQLATLLKDLPQATTLSKYFRQIRQVIEAASEFICMLDSAAFWKDSDSKINESTYVKENEIPIEFTNAMYEIRKLIKEHINKERYLGKNGSTENNPWTKNRKINNKKIQKNFVYL